jgi:hypothetical protein
MGHPHGWLLRIEPSGTSGLTAARISCCVIMPNRYHCYIPEREELPGNQRCSFAESGLGPAGDISANDNSLRDPIKRVIVTPAIYPCLDESLHFNIQSIGQKSHCINIAL